MRSIAALLPYNSRHEILLQHRTKDAPHYPDYWGFFGGGPDEGETPEEALKREAKEELGLEIEDYEFFKHYEVKREEDDFELYVYLLPTTLTVEQLRAQQMEGVELGFFTIDDAAKLKLIPANLEIMKDVPEYLSSKA